MNPLYLRPNATDCLEQFIGTILTGDDLYLMDGETAFRRTGRSIETFDAFDELDAYGETLEDGGKP